MALTKILLSEPKAFFSTHLFLLKHQPFIIATFIPSFISMGLMELLHHLLLGYEPITHEAVILPGHL